MLTGQILLQLAVILLVVQLFGFLSTRIGQQLVIGEILAGLALGPSLLGLLAPGVKNFLFPATTLSTLQTLGDIGLVLYMFSLGARLDTHLMVRQSKTAIVTSITGIVLPLALGMTMASFLFSHLAGPKATQSSFLLLVGTSMAITAFPVLARILVERKLLRTRVGTLALTSAAVDDITAWCLLALVIAVAQFRDARSVLLELGLLGLFLLGMFLVVRPLLAYTNRQHNFNRFVCALTLILLMLSSYCTNAIGIHPVFGAFLMGIILPRKTMYVELVHHIDQVNTYLFLPLYFVYSGLRTQIGLISTPWLWFICLMILMIACVGKISGGVFAMRAMREPWHEALCLGILMNTRGLVELVVLNIGLDLGILSPAIFAMLVIMALVTTMMASPLLSLSLRYRPYQEPHEDVDALPQIQSVFRVEPALPHQDPCAPG